MTTVITELLSCFFSTMREMLRKRMKSWSQMIGIYRHHHVGRTCTRSFCRSYPPPLRYEDVELTLTVEWKLAHLNWPKHTDHFFRGRSADLGINIFFSVPWPFRPWEIMAPYSFLSPVAVVTITLPSLFYHSFKQACRVGGPLPNCIIFDLDITCECQILKAFFLHYVAHRF